MRSGASDRLTDRIAQEHPNLWKHFEGTNCSFAAYQFIAQLLKPKALILAGMDCAFPERMRRLDGEKIDGPKPGEQFMVALDPDGVPWITNDTYMKIAEMTAAMLLHFSLAGVNVLNATEGGIIAEKLLITMARRSTLEAAVTFANVLNTTGLPAPTVNEEETHDVEHADD